MAVEPILLEYIKRGNDIELFWNYVTPPSGNITLFTVLCKTLKSVSGDDVIEKETIHYGASNPVSGSYFFGELPSDTVYLVSVTQFVGQLNGSIEGIYQSNTVELATPRAPSDALELTLDGIIIGQKMVNLEVIYPENYESDPPLTNIVFNISSDTSIVTQKFTINGDNRYVLTNLQGDTEYEIVCYGINSDGPGESSNTIVIRTTGIPPPPQEIVTLTSYLNNSNEVSVLVNWSTPENHELYDLTGYDVNYRVKNSGNNYISVDAELVTTTTLGNIFVDRGVVYEFTVSAKNDFGTSSPSGGSEVTISERSPAVTGLVAIPSNRTLVAEWSAPESNYFGGLSLTHYNYELYGADLNNPEIFGVILSGHPTTVTFNNLTNGSSYTIKVHAVTTDTASGNIIDGELSEVVSIPFNDVIQPVITVIPMSESIQVNWDEPNLEGMVNPSYEYRLQNSSEWVPITSGIVSSGVGRTYIINGLTNGERYNVSVRTKAENPSNSSDVRYGTPSESVEVDPYTTPSQVSNFEIEAKNESLYITWDILPNMGNLDISYLLQRLNNDDEVITSWPTSEVGSAQGIRRVRIYNLTNGQLYKYRVSSSISPTIVNDSISTRSSHVFAEAYPFTNPGEPLNFRTTLVGSGSVTLAWDHPSNGGFELANYILKSSQPVTIDVTNYPANSQIILSSTSNEVVVGGMVNGTSTIFTLLATTLNLNLPSDNELTSSEVSLTISSYAQSNSVTSFSATPTNGTVSLSWVSPSATGGFPLTDYLLRRYELDDQDEVILSSNVDVIVNNSAVSYVANSLENGKKYQFVLIPRTSPNGIVVEGSDSIVSTIPYTNSTFPFGVSAEAGNNSVMLRWSTPSNTGGFPVHVYRLRKRTTPENTNWVTVNNDVFEYQYTSLTNGIEKTFEILAVTLNANNSDEEILGQPSVISSVPYRNPTSVTNLNVYPSDNQIRIVWEPPENNGGFAINNYHTRIKVSSSDEYGEWTIHSSSTREHTFTGLDNGTQYTLQVSASSSNPFSDDEPIPGDIETRSSMAYKVSEKPTDVNVVPGNGTLLVRWVAPLNTGGFDIVEYRIYLDDVLESTFTGGFGGLLESLISALDNGTTYQVKVSAVTSNDFYTDGEGNPVKFEGEFSDLVSGKPYTNPEPVNNLLATPKDNKILVTFDYPSNDGGNSIHRADIKVSNLSEEINESTNYADATNDNGILKGSLEVSGLNNGTNYDVNVTVVTKNVSLEDVSSIIQNISNVMPFGRPIITNYVINTINNSITIEMNNNGRLIEDVLVVAPSNDSSVDNIISRDDIGNPIVQSSDNLTSTYTANMSYQLLSKEEQPILIVADNDAGMTYETNLTSALV